MSIERTEEILLTTVVISSEDESDRPYPLHKLLMEEFQKKAFLLQQIYLYVTQKSEAPRRA